MEIKDLKGHNLKDLEVYKEVQAQQGNKVYKDHKEIRVQEVLKEI